MKWNLKDTLCQYRERLHNVQSNFDCSYCNMVRVLSMQTTKARNDEYFLCSTAERKKRREINEKPVLIRQELK